MIDTDKSTSITPKVYVDQGANMKRLKVLQATGKIILLQAGALEQQFKVTTKQGRAFTIGSSSIGGPDMIAGDNVGSVRNEMGIENDLDFNHIYAAYLNGCDYFVTENPKDFIHNGKKARLETMLNIKIMRSDDFLKEFQI